jgi:aldehyde:ferredoxin oxidoreductase
MLFDEAVGVSDPLSSYNILTIMTGPLSNTITPSSGRVSIAYVSPASCTYAESDIGGTWGVEVTAPPAERVASGSPPKGGW